MSGKEVGRTRERDRVLKRLREKEREGKFLYPTDLNFCSDNDPDLVTYGIRVRIQILNFQNEVDPILSKIEFGFSHTNP